MSQELFTWLIGLGSFLVLLWAIRKPAVFIYRLIIKTHDVAELLNGTPEKPGLDERLGVIEGQMQQQSYTLGELRHELKPNGGSSMNDRLTRVEKHLNPDAPDNK